MSTQFGCLEREYGHRVNLCLPYLEEGISCTCQCFLHYFGCSAYTGREGELDHPIAFASRKLSKVEKNYSMTEHEGLAMVYVLQKFKHYILGRHFKMYIDHSSLKYLVNKPVLGGGGEIY